MSGLLLLLTVTSPAAMCAVASDDGEQCHGFAPMPSVSTFLGAALQYSTAERICCHNHAYAEYRGYLDAPEVRLFDRLDPDVETVFYDSVCGVPLFVAPRGRSFAAFREESLRHGWPSFRPSEVVAENVIIHEDGRMESTCRTHLGHNLPEGGVDRYCIDLVCVAGAPLPPDDPRAHVLTLLHESAIRGDEFNSSTYVSSAETFSGKYPKFPTTFLVVLASVVGVLAVIYCYVGPVCHHRRVSAVTNESHENQIT